ncbi:hypothetical protein H4218_001291 [Coemansia sp. IMI 209128]|nr:hypothetical protein GGI10_002759 [Coemansia sp. RSA 2530]KAJ2701691.1 hypothetical protein H4218_001291 [Coemansia sp. IMI 209128]
MTATTANIERVVLISGCSAGGIGYHLALELAAHGCRVFAGVRTLSKAQALADNPRIDVVELDITSDASVDTAVANVLAATGGRIDILVNNAGIHSAGPSVEAPLARVQRVWDTNFMGVVRLCRAVAPYMMDSRQGTVVNVGSTGGYVTTPWMGIYTSTKVAVHAYSDALRMELAPFGVSVVVVVPGCIQSNIVNNYSDTLPDDDNTRYAMARQAIEEKTVLSQAPGATPTSKFAQVIVPKILRSSPRAYITYGHHSSMIWCMYYVPPAIRDYLFSRWFGTHQLAKDLRTPSLPAPMAYSMSVCVALVAVMLGAFYALF